MTNKQQIPSKEEIVKYYITDKHSVSESAIYFNTSKTTFKRWLHLYTIQKGPEDIKRKQDNITKEDLIQYYINENHSVEECAIHYNISKPWVQKILHKFNIMKDKDLVIQLTQKHNIEKYGVANITQTEDFKIKAKQTCLKKYGNENAASSEEIKNKRKATCLKKYGSEFFVTTSEFRQKTIENNNKKYGTDSHTQTEAFKEKMRQINLENKGVQYTFQDPNVQKKIKNAMIEKYGVEHPLQSPEILSKMCNHNIEKYGTPFLFRSQYEDEIINILDSLGINNIVKNDRSVLNGQEIDIYLPDYKLGIEFNGDYWHSDVQPKYQDNNGRSLTHQKKSLSAEEKGVFLFHIFEYEWNNENIRTNIINRLKTLLSQNTTRIPARKTIVVELNKEQKKEFLNNYHIQGNDHATKCYGLVYDNEIISCMTFVHPKNNKYTWELSRFCNKHEYVVQGGASKLFKHFVDTLNINDTVSSYNDITKTKGDLYKILGFECISINSPNYVWMNFNTGDIRTRYQEQKAGEVKRMHDQGYHRICDCGTKTWVFTKK